MVADGGLPRLDAGQLSLRHVLLPCRSVADGCRRGYSAETGRGGAAAATWIFCGDESRRCGRSVETGARRRCDELRGIWKRTFPLLDQKETLDDLKKICRGSKELKFCNWKLSGGTYFTLTCFTTIGYGAAPRWSRRRRRDAESSAQATSRPKRLEAEFGSSS